MLRKSITLAVTLLVTGLTLVWAQAGGTPVLGDSFDDKMSWLEAFAQSGGNYIVEVRADENVAPRSLSYSGKTNITITLRGTGANRTLSLSSNGAMFTVPSGVTLVLDSNITLRGRNNNNSSLINVGGRFIMNNGSTITGNSGGGVSNGGTFTMTGGTISGNANTSATTSGGGVNNGGTFTMSGGTISGNTSTNGGGVYVWNNGIFTMSGGTISGNTGTSGGGVYVNVGSFTMSGGTISGNTSSGSGSGGGVYVNNAGTFAKTGGTITGYASDRANGNVVKDASGTIRNYRGHVVYAASSVPKIREATAGPGDNLSYSPTAVSGAWDN